MFPHRNTSARNAVLWGALVCVSLPLAWLLGRAGLPAASLVAAMLCGIAFGVKGAALRVPRRAFQAAQALVGCAVAQSITGDIVTTIRGEWPMMLFVVGGAVAAGGVVGWTLCRARWLPGTTAAWGSTPGAASAMVAMAEDYGADARLVALMQYLRVLVVVLTASLVSHFLLGGAPPAPPIAAPQVPWPQLALTLGIALAGAGLGVWLRVPAGAMLVPMLFGALLHSLNLASIHQPAWLQAIASLLLGWYVGLGFDRALLTSALRLLPRLLASALLLIALCALAAWLLVVRAHIDPLTAYLSTSPGGLDSVVLIAMGSDADVPFVVAVQTLRLFVVILVGPAIARLICKLA
jgi:membrane AbrB-like protein